MARFGLIGSDYLSQSPNADAQRTINLYEETDESGQGQSTAMLYHTPGLKVAYSLPNMTSVRTVNTFYGRTFAIAENLSNQYLFELFADGTSINRFQLGSAGTSFLATMTANNNANPQMMITSAGRLFRFNSQANGLAEIDTTSGNAVVGAVQAVSFTDSYFVVLIANSQKIQRSALLDGSQWSPLDIIQVSLYTDNIVSMIIDHREIWLLGPKATVVYGDTGDLLQPFLPIPGAYIEQGAASFAPPVKLDNSIFWVGADERGAGIGWRAQGYSPQRVTNHAEETLWQSFPTLSDVESYAYQDQGHAFWVLRFPSANRTRVYDVATGKWHERAYGNTSSSNGTAHRSRCHVFAFNKHLVGDWASGNIYEMSISLLDDAGAAIRRVRRSPHIGQEQQWLKHYSLQVDLETGLGPQPPLLTGGPVPRARGPQLMLRWSDDGGHTWSNEYMHDCGQAGEYRKRVRQTRLGRSRDRIYEIAMSDPVPWRIIDAYLMADGFAPQERLVKTAGKSA